MDAPNLVVIKYKSRIAKIFHDFGLKLANAPIKSGWDPMFKAPIPSQREVIMQRDVAIANVVAEAKLLGIPLKLNVPDSEPYVSPFTGEKVGGE